MRGAVEDNSKDLKFQLEQEITTKFQPIEELD